MENIFNKTHLDYFKVVPEHAMPFKEIPSKVMWAVALYVDPSSPYARADLFTKRELIESDYLGEPLDWDLYSSTVEKYRKLTLSKKKQILQILEDKIDEKMHLISSTPYNVETYEMLDKMVASTDKFWKQYIMYLKDVEDEDAATFGGFRESLNDSGEI